MTIRSNLLRLSIVIAEVAARMVVVDENPGGWHYDHRQRRRRRVWPRI